MSVSRALVASLIPIFGLVGCGGGIESGIPKDAPQGVAPVFETKPISPKDMPKSTGPRVPTPGKA